MKKGYIISLVDGMTGIKSLTKFAAFFKKIETTVIKTKLKDNIWN